MKTSNHSSSINNKLLIDGSYVIIYETQEGVLSIIWRHRVNFPAFDPPSFTSNNNFLITNKDGTTTNLILPTIFENASSIVREIILPLDVKSISIVSEATEPPGGPE